MTDIKSMTERQLADFFKNMGQPAFRAKQVFTWLHRGVRSFDEMTDLSSLCVPGWPRRASLQRRPWPGSRPQSWTGPLNICGSWPTATASRRS